MNKTIATNYRVIETTASGLGISKDSFAIKRWEGTDLKSLCRLYPPSNILGVDALGRIELEDGLIIICHEFERQLSDGTWEPIDDPRLYASCEEAQSIRHGEDCQRELENSEEENLCANCELDSSAPSCNNCNHELVDGDDGMCSGCRRYASLCINCETFPRNGNDNLCRNCRRADVLHGMWLRVLQACQFWRKK